MVKVYSEADVQSIVRMRASALGWRLWRNNVGVLKDTRGLPVRYGLANDSTAVNKVVKSGDLIGIRPVLITQEMVGHIIGQFTSIECKASKWTGTTDARHQAQKNWCDLVNTLGGNATITNGGGWI